jgi:omega-amidase
MTKKLTVSVVQYDIAWENIYANFNALDKMLQQVPDTSHIILLPETFATGFTMQPQKHAQSMDGEIVTWMKRKAISMKKIIIGSVAIQEEGKYYNRLICVFPNGILCHYDKRHLFSLVGEQEHYEAGEQKLIIQVNGWKLALHICYDLRFPVWLRQSPIKDEQYDALLLVANWPERRIKAWSTLLQARAIENQAYVIAANRVGYDGNDIYHNGHSMIVDPLGEIIWKSEHEIQVYTYTLDMHHLIDIRSKFGFLNDIDQYFIP